MRSNNKYTVLLKFPDTVDSDRPIHIYWVSGADPKAALKSARDSAMSDTESDPECINPVDFECIVVYPGHLKDLNTED